MFYAFASCACSKHAKNIKITFLLGCVQKRKMEEIGRVEYALSEEIEPAHESSDSDEPALDPPNELTPAQHVVVESSDSDEPAHEQPASDDEYSDTEEAQKQAIRDFHDEITFDALMYSHVVLNCGRHEVHAPVLSTLMLMAVIGMSPATFFVGLGLGLPVFWLAQRCLAR
jgi:hypothetical protein